MTEGKTAASTEVRDAVSDAREALSQAQSAQLSLASRRNIWHALDRASEKVSGQDLRALVAASCARHVLPVWQARFPSDQRPQLLLEAIALKAADEKALHGEGYHYWGKLDSYFDHGPPFEPLYAGYSVARAAMTAHADEPNLSGSEEELGDPYSWDTAYIASLAVGAEASVQSARDYWTWYLDEVIRVVTSAADPL